MTGAYGNVGTYLTLVGEFGGGDIQLLVLLLQLGELGLQARLLQFSGVQLALQVLVVSLQALVISQQLLVCSVQPEEEDGELNVTRDVLSHLTVKPYLL